MKTKNPSATGPGHSSRPEAGIIALLIFSCTGFGNHMAMAQSAESIAKPTQESADAKPAAKEKPATRDKSAAQANVKPMDIAVAVGMASRFVSPEDLASYLKAMTGTLAMNDRATDPFGQPQDPDAKPVIKTENTKKSTRITQLKATPFTDIVRLIKVTTVMPAEKRFLIGTRSIREGQRFPINFRSKTINVLVSSVSSSRILLLNTDTNETASLDLNLLPVGMTPGNKGIAAPGMVLNSPNAVIELESDALPDQQPVNQ